MFISVFDIFKIGIGPSSSHTMGPMSAASRFLGSLRKLDDVSKIDRIEVHLYGSLAFTGRGHATDRAIILGLLGLLPDTLDPDRAEALENSVRLQKTISLDGFPTVKFDPETDLVFDYGPPLAGHANGMMFTAFDRHDNKIIAETYYSIGGGFIVNHDELQATLADKPLHPCPDNFPYPFENASQMLKMGKTANISLMEMKQSNEEAMYPDRDLAAGLAKIWSVMDDCINRGLGKRGILPGGLNVKRRAACIHEKLLAEKQNNSLAPHAVNDWLSIYAMSVNEENAAGGRIVTAPTNGAAGVVPSVIKYYQTFCPGSDSKGIQTFLLAAGAIGGLIKHNASISGAEVGCQGEVGSASAMAAAGLCAALGGTNEQIENAAEIALEHHLGMTCDPIGGLVQVPCIERNGMGAVKAVTAAS
ncbi:MAG: L-serine ammonia-lyase, partial [Cohaesibacteraceae bacterium]|nr:L-serine ammonia-lyase [Cohaesibacteraceae bacterium]